MTAPRSVAGIRNFGWVEPGVVARGEQPSLEAATFARLKDIGITAILSLRPDREIPSPNPGRPWPEYHLEEERAVVLGAGLRFHHVPLEDFSAPTPERVAAALTTLDQAVAEAPGVYVHCRAGAGRTAIVTGAWSVAHGRTGDEAADAYQRFMLQIWEALGHTDQDLPILFQRVGQPKVYWALRAVVAALGSPVTVDPPHLLPPERPPEADHWEQRYREALQPWRT
jgi:protein tyrosine phosphatase (PTP) superfamily phosphohydrolase (DUF442 family)